MNPVESAVAAREPAAGRARSADLVQFAAVVAAAFAFLSIAGYPRQWTLGLLINDEFWYAHLARSLYEGLGYVTQAMYPMQAPRFDAFPVPEGMKQSGYPLVTALVWQLTGVSIRAMVWVSAVGMSLFSGGAFLLARRLGWGRGTALFVAGATVANPLIAQYGVQALPESLYFACFIFTVLLVLRGDVAGAVGAGLANAVLIIIKGHGIIYVPVFFAFLWLRRGGAPRDALMPDARKLRVAGSYFGVLLLTLVLASALLPDGAVQIFEASGSYSYGFLIEVGRETSALAYLETQPPDPWGYILEHPGQYLDKVARQVRRTKIIVDDLGGPAFMGILFPGVLLAAFLLLANLALPNRFLPPTETRADVAPYLLFLAAIGISFAFFWPIHLVTRFITHLFPLMLLLVLYVLWRLGALVGDLPPKLRPALVIAAVGYFAAYPAAVTVWQSYRTPMQHIGSQLAVRFLDYETMASNVASSLPDKPVVISDMGHEITWYNRADTILFPNQERDLAYLVERYDVDALYEHPMFPRDWPSIREHFRLVDDDDGFLWVRRRAP